MATHPTLQVGDLVGVNEARGPQLAVVQSLKGSRAELRIGFDGRSLQLPLRDLFLLAAHPPAAAAVARQLADPPWQLTPERLAAGQPKRRLLGEAWLLLVEDPQLASAELADLVDLVGDQSDPAQVAACWLWIQGDQTLFRYRQAKITARSQAELRQLRHDRHRKLLEQRRRNQWHQLLVGRQCLDPTNLTAWQQQELLLLRRLASGEADQPLPPDLLRALRDAHCAAEAGAIRHLLVDLGQWERHHLPALESTIWEQGFPQELLEEAERLLLLADQCLAGDASRQDLAGQHVVTIDDQDTREIDDGLALETFADGRQRLWIHIADPGRLVAADSPLDLEARRRASSLYLARGSLSMFPPSLAHGPMSLRSGQRCAAWSIWVELDASGAVQADGIERSWIQPTYRLTYADADELIELAPPQEADLLAIHALLERRRAWRAGQGALMMDDPEGRIRSRGELAEVEVVEPSASRRMVAEAMVLAGALVAERGERQGLALPYRSQPACDLPPAAELEQLPSGPVRHAAIKRCLSRGQVGTTPAPHFSLGLGAYAQATSPIRRYGDLLVQRQLEALREGKPALTEQAVAQLIQELESPLRQGIQIAREDQRHWLQVWVEQQQQRQWPGQFLRWLRQEHQLGLVWIEEICQSLPCQCPGRSAPGDGLLVRVAAVDSLSDLLRLDAVA